MHTLPIFINISQNSSKHFINIDKMFLKFVWKGKISRIANTKLEYFVLWGIRTLPKFKTFCKTIIFTIMFY